KARSPTRHGLRPVALSAQSEHPDSAAGDVLAPDSRAGPANASVATQHASGRGRGRQAHHSVTRVALKTAPDTLDSVSGYAPVQRAAADCLDPGASTGWAGRGPNPAAPKRLQARTPDGGVERAPIVLGFTSEDQDPRLHQVTVLGVVDSP